MLEEIASSRFGFWIVAAVMVAIDSSFLLKPGKFAFSVSASNLVNIRVATSPFLIRNKELVCSLLSFPFQLFFISDVETLERATGRETLKALSRLSRVSRQNTIFSILSVCGISLLLLGPLLAATHGIQASLVSVFPLFYLLACINSAMLWRRRRKFGLSGSAVIKISAEIILCPILLVNISKRISLAQTLELNTYRLALHSRSPPKIIAAIKENVQFYDEG
jgi:hypothetical protein